MTRLRSALAALGLAAVAGAAVTAGTPVLARRDRPVELRMPPFERDLALGLKHCG